MYIDILFVTNLIIDAMIFLSASILLKRSVKWWRLTIAAATGAAYSCFAYLCSLPQALLSVLSVALYVGCTYILFGRGTVRSLIKNSLITLLCAAIYGGVAFLLYFFTGAGSVAAFNNNTLYIDIPIFILLCFSFGAFGAIWVFSKLAEYLSPKNSIADVKICFGENEVSGKGFVDTGNSLRDQLTGGSVIVCEYKLIRDILPQGVRSYLKSSDISGVDNIEAEWQPKIRLVGYSTIADKGLLPGLKSDSVKVNQSGKEILSKNTVVAVVDKSLSENGQYNILLSRQIMGEER